MPKQEKIKVLHFPMFDEPQWLEIENTLKAKQKLVEGLIDFISLEYWDGPVGVDLVINDEGKFNFKPNRAMHNKNGEFLDFIAGPFFAVGGPDEEGDSTSLTPEDAEKVINYFNDVERY